MIGNQYYKKAPPLLYAEKISKDTFNEHILQKEHHDDYDHKKSKKKTLDWKWVFCYYQNPDNKNHRNCFSFCLPVKEMQTFRK